MATARDVVYRAFQKLQVKAAGETPEAADLAEGLISFNDMMHGLKLEGIPLDWRTLKETDDVPLPDEDISAIVYLLAVELAPDYGREVDPAVATKAERARTFLQTKYTDIPKIQFDDGLTRRTDIFGQSFDIVTGS